MDCKINLSKLQEARSDILISCVHGHHLIIEYETNEIIFNGKRTGLKPWFSKENRYFSLLNIEQYSLRGKTLIEVINEKGFIWNKNKYMLQL